MANTDMPIVMGSADEIPVRKIEIISESGQKLDPTKREIIVRAKLHPADASYQDVEWSVVNDAGIESNIAKVEANGLEAKITALGDGSFRVRCTSKNGTDKTKLISQLEFEATGLGVAYKDPYGFIAGGLYDISRGEVGSGNERGVATARDGETVVGFSNIDFGPYGSDTITIPIFALSNEEYPIQIWEGMPGEEGSELLADVIYQKEPIWNVYQEETFRLKRRVKGIATISFVTQSKIHIKGFSFERLNRAFERNAAAGATGSTAIPSRSARTALKASATTFPLNSPAWTSGSRGYRRSSSVVIRRSIRTRSTSASRVTGERATSSSSSPSPTAMWSGPLNWSAWPAFRR